jgi:hypothetical protein
LYYFATNFRSPATTHFSASPAGSTCRSVFLRKKLICRVKLGNDAAYCNCIPQPSPEAEKAAEAVPHAPTARALYDTSAGESRVTGFSTIGRLTTADSTPNRIESHHTTSYDPVCS